MKCIKLIVFVLMAEHRCKAVFERIIFCSIVTESNRNSINHAPTTKPNTHSLASPPKQSQPLNNSLIRPPTHPLTHPHQKLIHPTTHLSTHPLIHPQTDPQIHS